MTVQNKKKYAKQCQKKNVPTFFCTAKLSNLMYHKLLLFFVFVHNVECILSEILLK